MGCMRPCFRKQEEMKIWKAIHLNLCNMTVRERKNEGIHLGYGVSSVLGDWLVGGLACWWLEEPVGVCRNHRRLRCLRLTGRGLRVCGESLDHPEQKSCVFFSLLLRCSTPVLTPQRLWAQTSTSPGSQWKCMTSAGTLRSSWWDPMGSLSCAGPTLLLSALSRLISWRTWSSSKPCRKAMLLTSLLESCSEKYSSS